MKIIKKGKVTRYETIYTGTCKNCGCEVECKPEEVSNKLNGPPFVKCPTDGCGRDITLWKEERIVKGSNPYEDIFKLPKPWPADKDPWPWDKLPSPWDKPNYPWDDKPMWPDYPSKPRWPYNDIIYKNNTIDKDETMIFYKSDFFK